jgi:hypothetical protein
MLGNVEARPLRFDHVNDAAQVAFGAPEALDDLGMALVDRVLIHGSYPIPPEGIRSSWNFWQGSRSLDQRVTMPVGDRHGPLSRADTIPVHILA